MTRIQRRKKSRKELSPLHIVVLLFLCLTAAFVTIIRISKSMARASNEDVDTDSGADAGVQAQEPADQDSQSH